jgi:L-amino acid N-acyltransferase YncA
MPTQLPLDRILKDGTPVEIDALKLSEQETVRQLLNAVITEGQTYPQEQPLSEKEFAAYWLMHQAFVVRTIPDSSKQQQSEILGAFYLKPNFPGRSAHICNAGFIVRSDWRGKGLGRLMGEAMLEIAVDQGYAAVMFNLVFETNIPSLNLWQSLGFQRIGHIPQAVHLSDGRRVDAFILYRSLR